MIRHLLAIVISFFASGLSCLLAEPVHLVGVEATNGKESHFEQPMDESLVSLKGWNVAPGGSQSAVYRATSPIRRGKYRVWISLTGPFGAESFGDIALSVTNDPRPSLASAWVPMVPVGILMDMGDARQVGSRVRVAAQSLKPVVRVDYLLPFDVTGLKCEVSPSKDAVNPATILIFRSSRSDLDSSNIALGCPVRASHPVGAEQEPNFLTDGLAGTFVQPAETHPPGEFFFEIDLGRVVTLDHISLVNRGGRAVAGRLSRLVIQLYEEKATGIPAWSCHYRDDGSNPEPGSPDVIRGSAGQGVFRGRYLRISSNSLTALSPELADVGVYERLTPMSVEVTAKDHPISSGAKVRIPTDADWITFTTVSPKLPNSARLALRARVIGYDDYWVPVGMKETLNYRGLRPGEYTFEAQLGHTDNIFDDTTIRIPFVVYKPWWQQPAFHIGIGVFAVGIAAWVTRSIVRRRWQRRVLELKRGEELSNERRRIARDMHDVVGSRLTQLAIMQEICGRKEGIPDDVRDQLRDLSKTARAAVGALDETVWAVNPRNDTLEGMAEYLCHTATDYLNSVEIACTEQVPDQWPEMPVGAQKRHGLLLAFKEALQNIAKHSGAKEVTLSLALEDHTFIAILEDNGCGLPSDLAGTEKDGLINMSNRLAELGGTCHVVPGTHGGTRVEMRLPL